MSFAKTIIFGAFAYALTTTLGFSLFCRFAFLGECSAIGPTDLATVAKLGVITAAPLVLLSAISSSLIAILVYRQDRPTKITSTLIVGIAIGLLPQLVGAVFSGTFFQSLYPSAGYLPFICAGITTAIVSRHSSIYQRADQNRMGKT